MSPFFYGLSINIGNRREGEPILDPVSAFAIATTAFKTIQKAVAIGQDFENVSGQLGKWYTAVADIRKAKELNNNPPLFKKVFAAGSVEEEALQLLMHEKKIQEMENDLRSLVNFRYGHNTWNELLEMRRKIRKDREQAVYRKQELKKNILDGIAIITLFTLIAGFLFFLVWLAKERGIF